MTTEAKVCRKYFNTQCAGESNIITKSMCNISIMEPTNCPTLITGLIFKVSLSIATKGLYTYFVTYVTKCVDHAGIFIFKLSLQ